MDEAYDQYFGFLWKMKWSDATCMSIRKSQEESRNWYDDIVLANTEIYNPWSVINYIMGRTPQVY